MNPVATPLTLDREALARDIGKLPSLPPVVMELLALMRADSSLDRLTQTLSLDQALAARVLQLANTPFYGVSGRIVSIQDGISVLGLGQVGCLVLAAALTLQFDALYGKSLRMDIFWRHSVACAVAARHLAHAKGLDTASAFTAGLLHDVGRLVIDSHYPQEMALAVQWSEIHDMPRHEAERQILGICHVEVGAWVSRHWRFAPEVVQAIANHHHPGSDAAPLTDLVHIADAVAHALDLSNDPQEVVPAVNEGAWNRLQLTEDIVHDLLGSIEREFLELAEHLRPSREAS